MGKEIKSGEATLDDLPPNLGWLKGDLEKRLELKKEVDKVDIKALLREELKAEKEVVRFQDLREELNVVLDSEKKGQVADAYKRLLNKGLSELDSLEMAMEVAGVDLDKIGTDARRSRMRIPSPGRRSSAPKDMDSMPWGDVTKNFTKEQRQEYLKKLL